MGVAWWPRGVLETSTDEVDPCDEAEVYCAYGKPWGGIECLEHAIGAIGTLRQAEYSVPLDGKRLRGKVSEIERRYPQWRDMKANHERAERIERTKKAVWVGAAVGAVLVAIIKLWR